MRSLRDTNRILEELLRTLKTNSLVGEPESDFTEVPFEDRQHNTAHVTPLPLAYTPTSPVLATMEPLDTFLMGDEVINCKTHMKNTINLKFSFTTKLLANRFETVVGDLVNEVQSAFIANRKILDGPFILNDLIHWCKARYCSKFFVSTFLFFYADDVVFIGQWSKSNLSTIIHVQEYFFRASGLCINLQKSQIIGLDVESSVVEVATNDIGCLAIKPPFSYLGIIIGGHMSRIKAWDNVINKVLYRLSKWKMKSLSIDGLAVNLAARQTGQRLSMTSLVSITK
nr:RNA-directed DNA polymerase, eukaryota, reverse transcriptase zinc-binding domain protein [Tanacetum cinerariifolium]